MGGGVYRHPCISTHPADVSSTLYKHLRRQAFYDMSSATMIMKPSHSKGIGFVIDPHSAWISNLAETMIFLRES